MSGERTLPFAKGDKVRDGSRTGVIVEPGEEQSGVNFDPTAFAHGLQYVSNKYLVKREKEK